MNDEQREEFVEVLVKLELALQDLSYFCELHDLSDAQELQFDGTPINVSFDEAHMHIAAWRERVEIWPLKSVKFPILEIYPK